MALFNDLISMIGYENAQGLLVLLLGAIGSKVSWDSYNSKNISKKHEVDEAIKKMKEELQESLEKKLKDREEELFEKLEKKASTISKKIDDAEEKIQVTGEKANEIINKFQGFLDGTYDKPKISRAEIRRLKEGLFKD
jgi:hypothetical protein